MSCCIGAQRRQPKPLSNKEDSTFTEPESVANLSTRAVAGSSVGSAAVVSEISEYHASDSTSTIGTNKALVRQKKCLYRTHTDCRAGRFPQTYFSCQYRWDANAERFHCCGRGSWDTKSYAACCLAKFFPTYGHGFKIPGIDARSTV